MSTLTEEIHNKLVRKLQKSGEDILLDMNSDNAELLYCGVGISCEANEVLDVIKKHTFNTKELDLPHLIEELGDLEYHLERLRQILYISREEVLQASIDKLNKRYPKGYYTNTQALTRADESNG